MSLDAGRIRESLNRLRASRSSAFGADSHRFLLNEPLTQANVSAFESRYSVRLPEEYRHFLTVIANGGAGPFLGVFPLGMMDDGFILQPWQENGDFVGVLSKPFAFETEWNDLNGKPPDDLAELDPSSYAAKMDEFEQYYWGGALMSGAIPICHEGCALRVWLVVTGLQAGQLWHDGRADYTGLKPVRLSDGAVATFAPWYEEWLDKTLEESRSA